MTAIARPRNMWRTVGWSIVALILALGALMAHRGWSFYVMDVLNRPDHPEYRVLRPSGLIGNGYGYAAALLVFTNLLYLARRRIPGFRLGSMRLWLELHVLTGLAAAVFVLFHSAFQVRAGLAAIAAVSLVVVVVTGLVGRYLYALVPENPTEDLEDSIVDVAAQLPELRPQLRRALAENPGPRLPPNASLPRCLAAIPAWRRAGQRRREAIVGLVGPHLLDQPDDSATKKLTTAMYRLTGTAVADVRADAAKALLRSWRSMHRLFAITMLVTVAVHVGVAWWYGYRWIFH